MYSMNMQPLASVFKVRLFSEVNYFVCKSKSYYDNIGHFDIFHGIEQQNINTSNKHIVLKVFFFSK